MSGGPVVAAESGLVVGVVIAGDCFDTDLVAANWRDNMEGAGLLDFTAREHPPVDELVVAQLDLGMGIASSVENLELFLRSNR